MTWNYRIIKHKDIYAVHEVFYTKDKPHTWTENPINLADESYSGLESSFMYMRDAFDKPILTIKDGKLIEE